MRNQRSGAGPSKPPVGPAYSDRLLAIVFGLAVLTAAGCGLFEKGAVGKAQATATAQSKADATDVELCDGETHTKVPAGTPATRETGQKISADLMAQWLRKHPESDWVAEERERHELVPPADNRGLIGEGKGQTYQKVSERDVLVWERETVRLAVDGSRVFHSGDELGSEIAVSCDMCHPHAANTHPETYPKFQPQLGRVALLRDMVNWCIEHPVRGVKLAPDDPKMRALEAYIYAQRKGKALNYGQR